MMPSFFSPGLAIPVATLVEEAALRLPQSTNIASNYQ
jgi:hypothetical protein